MNVKDKLDAVYLNLFVDSLKNVVLDNNHLGDLFIQLFSLLPINEYIKHPVFLNEIEDLLYKDNILKQLLLVDVLSANIGYHLYNNWINNPEFYQKTKNILENTYHLPEYNEMYKYHLNQIYQKLKYLKLPNLSYKKMKDLSTIISTINLEDIYFNNGFVFIKYIGNFSSLTKTKLNDILILLDKLKIFKLFKDYEVENVTNEFIIIKIPIEKFTNHKEATNVLLNGTICSGKFNLQSYKVLSQYLFCKMHILKHFNKQCIIGIIVRSLVFHTKQVELSKILASVYEHYFNSNKSFEDIYNKQTKSVNTLK